MSAERYNLLFDASQQAVIVDMCMLENHLPPAMTVITRLRDTCHPKLSLFTEWLWSAVDCASDLVCNSDSICAVGQALGGSCISTGQMNCKKPRNTINYLLI